MSSGSHPVAVHFPAAARRPLPGAPGRERLARRESLPPLGTGRNRPHSPRQAQAAGVDLFDNTVSFRLIKVFLPNGTIEVLATSLTDTRAFPQCR
jgi:hypothetical protein